MAGRRALVAWAGQSRAKHVSVRVCVFGWLREGQLASHADHRASSPFHLYIPVNGGRGYRKNHLAKATLGIRGLQFEGVTEDTAERKTSGHSTSAVRKQEAMSSNIRFTFSPLFTLGPQSMQWCHPHSQ